MKAEVLLCDRCHGDGRTTLAIGRCSVCGIDICSECTSSLEIGLKTLKGMHEGVELLRISVCMGCLYKCKDSESKLAKELRSALDSEAIIREIAKIIGV